jgi:hypothetical protein
MRSWNGNQACQGRVNVIICPNMRLFDLTPNMNMLAAEDSYLQRLRSQYGIMLPSRLGGRLWDGILTAFCPEYAAYPSVLGWFCFLWLASVFASARATCANMLADAAGTRP